MAGWYVWDVLFESPEMGLICVCDLGVEKHCRYINSENSINSEQKDIYGNTDNVIEV